MTSYITKITCTLFTLRNQKDHINIKQLKVFQFFSRVRRSKFVRDGLPVEQAAEYADNFIRNFHDKKHVRGEVLWYRTVTK